MTETKTQETNRTVQTPVSYTHLDVYKRQVDGYSVQAYEPIQKVSDMSKLWEMLRKKGVSEDQLERIWRTNAVNVLKRIG